MRTPLISLMFIAVVLVSGVLANTTLSLNNSAYIPLKVGRWFDYVVVIMMENHSINNTYYNGHGANPCFGNCTYYTLLANQNGLAEEFTDNGILAGSQGEYVAITGGVVNSSLACNNGPTDPGCPLVRSPNIADRLDSAHLSWKAYMEDNPTTSGCNNAFIGHYSPAHNPFIYYANIQNNATRCNQIVRANTQLVTQSMCSPTAFPNDNVFLNALNSATTASNYMWLTPNSVDDNHDCDNVSVGNAWLNLVVPKILASPLFTTKRAALFVTFDEHDCTFSTCDNPVDEVYTVWASNPAIHTTKAGYKSITSYNHLNPLRTIEDNWNLPPCIDSTDGGAQNMQEFLN